MPYGTPTNFHVGELRWQVQLCTRIGAPDPNGAEIIETFINGTNVQASIMPIGLQTYIIGEQLENNPTHRIIIRFQDSLDFFDCVLRQILRADGSTRQELFRVFRVSEVDGRQRFTCIDAILEQRDG